MHDREYLSIAWTQAWPLISREAFARGLLRIEGGPSAGSHSLAMRSELKHWLRTRARGRSFEQLEALCQRAWFGCYDDRIPTAASWSLADYLVRLATSYLAVNGDACEVSAQHELVQRDLPIVMRRLRWLLLCLPPDLLVAGVWAEVGREPLSDSIDLVSRHPRRILELGVAETHLHVGAAVSFSLLWGTWIAAPRALASADNSRTHGEAPFESWALYDQRLWAAAVMRVMLAGFLFELARRGPRREFSDYAQDALFDWTEALAEYSATEVRYYAEAASAILHNAEVPELGMHSAHVFCRRLTRLTNGKSALRRADRKAKLSHELLEADPLESIYPSRAGLASPETRFTWDAFRYMRSQFGQRDQLFARLFWQYERVRVETYRFLTQEPGTPGLGWFQRHFARIDKFRRGVDAHMVRAAVELQEQIGELRSLEVRTAPNRTKQEALATLLWVTRAAKASERERRDARAPLELGVVFHFLKSEERLGDRPRFASWARGARQQASALCWLLGECPEALALIRGVDVASRELSLPTWVTVAPLRSVLAASRDAARRMHAHRPDWQLKPLGLTYHAGEEYRRLTEGLRRIHELIEYGLLAPGYRIGHGIALADDATRCFPAGSIQHQPLEERLDDVLWELDRYAFGDLPCVEARAKQLEHDAGLLIDYIFGDYAQRGSLRTHQAARRQRHTAAARFCHPDLVLSPPGELHLPEHVASAYLFDLRVRARGQEICEIRSSEAEVAMLNAAQSWLRQRLARMQITVECNPSSNHLIADYDSVDMHPALRLQPLSLSAAADTVMVSINSDDPLTFATRLADEFSYMYCALLRSGASSQDALTWLDKVRELGMRSRFTLPASHQPAILDEILKRFTKSGETP